MATSNSNNGAGGNTAASPRIVIEASPGETIRVPLETLQGATLTQEGGSLLITPANGSTPILLQDFLTFGTTENPPVIELASGNVMPIQQITPLVENYSVGDITPAAGNDANTDGGGANFQPYHDGSIGDPLGIAGLLPPTDLSFSQDTPEEIIGVNTNSITTSVGSNPFATISLSFQTLPFPATPGPVSTFALFAAPTPAAASVGDSAVSGGYEDWQPNQNTGDHAEAPMQMLIGFSPRGDEQLTSIDISGFPAGSRFFVGGSDDGHEVDVSGGSYTVATVGGSLPDMYVLAPANDDTDIAFNVTGHYMNDAGQTGTANASGTAVIDAVADMPVITGSDASGGEDSAIALPGVSAALQDTDGSETLSVSISGVPAGAVLSDGSHSFAGDGSSSVDVTGWDLSSLTVTPPANDDTDFSLTLTATATEGASVATGGELTDANNVATDSLTINVTVDPGSDTPTVVVLDAAGKEDLGSAADQIAAVPAPDSGDIPLSIMLTTGEGGTESGYVVLSGYPAGVTFSAGAAVAGGWQVDQADLGSLSINGLPADSDADFSITVTPWSQDGSAAPVAGTAGTIHVLVDAVADIPTLTLDGSAANGSVSGAEDTAIALPDVAAGLQDTDGSETLSVSIGGLPTGATLSDGVNSFVGDGNAVDITGWNLSNLSVTSAPNDDGNFTLTVTATSTEGAAEAPGSELQDDDNSASTSFNIDVNVSDTGPVAVDDGPEHITEPSMTHAVFVIDTSQSLSSDQLQLMEDALKNLATTLFSQNPDGTKITLIDFDTHAQFIGSSDGTFDTLASTLNALNNLSDLSGGSTNYNEALTLTQSVNFDAGSQPEIYFISDGQPTRGDTNGAITSFNNWVANDVTNAHVYSVGIGTDANNSQFLGQFDNTPDDNNVTPTSGGPYLYVNDPGDLDGSLITSHIELNGNVLTNDSPGDDPLNAVPISSVEYHGTSYDLSSTGTNVSVNGNELTLTGDYGVLTLNFETGDYTYTANTDISNFQNEVFKYTISDTDGHTASANLTIEISPDTAYTGTAAADNIVGGVGNDYVAGQAGDDSLTGGEGNDRFVFQSAASDGHDTIHDFGAHGDADVIDLSSLFDDLGINSANRADHINFSASGSDTVITVTNAADAPIPEFSITVENTALGAADLHNGKIVVDES